MAGGGGGPARRAGGRAARVSTGERVRDVFRTERDEGEGEGLLLGHSGWVEAVSWERVGGEVFRGSARGGEKVARRGVSRRAGGGAGGRDGEWG